MKKLAVKHPLMSVNTIPWPDMQFFFPASVLEEDAYSIGWSVVDFSNFSDFFLIEWGLRGSKKKKKSTFDLLWLLNPLIVLNCHPKFFKPTSYTTKLVRHFSIKFYDDTTDSAQLMARRIGKRIREAVGFCGVHEIF